MSSSDTPTTSTTTNKRSYTRLDFTLEDEEKLIDHVKSNPAHYNPSDINYKNKMYRERLWTKFAGTINKTGSL